MVRIFRLPRSGLLPTVLVLLALAGCAAQTTTQTGFLGDYSRMQADPNHPDNRVWVRRGALAPCRGFLIDAVVYRPAENAPALDAETQSELTQAYREKLLSAFSERYRPATGPGPGIVRVRAAVTNVAKAQPILNALTMVAIFVPVTAGGAASEAEIVDSVSGERLAAYEGFNNGGRSFLGGPIGFLSQYGQARRAFGTQAEELRDLLDDVAAQ